MTTEHNGGEEPGHGDSQTHAMGRSDMATHACGSTNAKDKRHTTAWHGGGICNKAVHTVFILRPVRRVQVYMYGVEKHQVAA